MPQRTTYENHVTIGQVLRAVRARGVVEAELHNIRYVLEVKLAIPPILRAGVVKAWAPSVIKRVEAALVEIVETRRQREAARTV